MYVCILACCAKVREKALLTVLSRDGVISALQSGSAKSGSVHAWAAAGWNYGVGLVHNNPTTVSRLKLDEDRHNCHMDCVALWPYALHRSIAGHEEQVSYMHIHWRLPTVLFFVINLAVKIFVVSQSAHGTKV